MHDAATEGIGAKEKAASGGGAASGRGAASGGGETTCILEAPIGTNSNKEQAVRPRVAGELGSWVAG